ncbi:hypothetical protein SAMN05443249_3570 [Beijerinckia sp. 28-YEA-48]|nr:hypothetical protein SAMN05443249_3570 [Beijerinckia sp. 28-YEA-48]
MRHGVHSLSAFEAALPLLFTAAAIASLGWGANLYGRLHPAPAVETAQVPSTMSKRQEEKLAADMSAFALAKVAPERLVSEATREAFNGPTLPPLRLANVAPVPRAELKLRNKGEKQPTKVASVLPPARPAVITSSQVAASRVAAIAPPPATVVAVHERGVVARVAEYVPSPRQMFDGVRTLSGTLGDQVSRYIPRI